MKVSVASMAAVSGFTPPEGRKHEVGRAERQPGNDSIGVCSPDTWVRKSGCRGE